MDSDELEAMTCKELLSFAEGLGLHLSTNAEKEALLGELYRLGTSA